MPASSFFRLKQAAAICTLIGVLLTSYVAVGLPVPATMYQVDSRIAPILTSIKSLKVLTISNSLDQLDTKKGILRSERTNLEQALIGVTDIQTKAVFSARIVQIADEIHVIDRRSEELARKSDDIEKTP